MHESFANRVARLESESLAQYDLDIAQAQLAIPSVGNASNPADATLGEVCTMKITEQAAVRRAAQLHRATCWRCFPAVFP
jgi:hypothetical protein